MVFFDYPRTLREWGRWDLLFDPSYSTLTVRAFRRFSQNWGNEEVMASLAKSQPQLLRVPGALEAFKRKWEYLWVYAEVGYARAYTSMHHFTFMRPVSGTHNPARNYRLKLRTGVCLRSLRLTLLKDVEHIAVIRRTCR